MMIDIKIIKELSINKCHSTVKREAPQIVCYNLGLQVILGQSMDSKRRQMLTTKTSTGV